MGKSKKKPHKPKSEDTNQEKLYLLHMDLCGPMRVTSVNGKKYILEIVDDYSRFTWVKFLRLKDEAPDFIINVDHPSPKFVAPIDEVAAPVPAVSTGSPSSTTVDQDEPSTSNSQTTPDTQPPVIPNDVRSLVHDIEFDIWNKARLVARGYRQGEGINFEESLLLGSKIEWILPWWRNLNWMRIKNGKAVDPITLLWFDRNPPLSYSPVDQAYKFAICMCARIPLIASNRVCTDAGYDGCQDTRRSTSGSMQFLGDRLISWSSKRQKSDAISSTEAEKTNNIFALAVLCSNPFS
ncbi:retrovirus-related pol polyprotein from transposon TNT 1-94 [Tanacetum coccineum]